MLARLIQQKVPLGSPIKFSLKTGREISGILTEIGQEHITVEASNGPVTILTEMIGLWESSGDEAPKSDLEPIDVKPDGSGEGMEARPTQKEEKSFGDRASQNLIDFTYPADLFEIIFARGLWQEHFQPIFGNDPNYWDERKKLLAKCRNPLAHNRAEILQSHELMIVEGYCTEILSCVQNITLPTNLSNE